MSLDYGSFRLKILKGATWLAAQNWLSRGVSIVSLLILARILTPEDFGVAALALVSLTALEVIGGFSFELALIKDQKAGREDYNSVWTLAIIRNLVIGGLLLVGADLFAGFFEEERLSAVLRVLAIGVFIEGFHNVGAVDFRKELQYDKEFRLNFGATLTQFGTTIVLAILLQSYWALIGGVVMSRVVKTILTYKMHPYRPSLTLTRWKHIMRFSRWLVLGNIINYIYNQFPVIVLGKTVSKHALGVFHVGQEMATFPTVRVIAPVLQVIFPGLAKISDDRSLTGRAVRELMAILAFIAFPAALGLSFVAPEVVPVLLGGDWSEAVPVIQVLAIYGLFRVWQSNAEMIFLAQDKAHLVMNMRLVGAIAQVILVSLAVTYWDVLEACYAMAAAAAIAGFAAVYASARVVGLTATDYVRATWRPILCSVAMIGVLEAWRTASAGSQFAENPILALVMVVALGVSTYFLCHSIISLLVKSDPDLETDVIRDFVFSRLPIKRDMPG